MPANIVVISQANADSGVTKGAPNILFYKALTEDCCGEDPHPVHGIESPDGGYLVAGKSLDSAGSWQGFIAKVGPTELKGTSIIDANSSSELSWSYSFGEVGKREALNSIAATGSSVYAAGLTTGLDGTPDRHLIRFDLVTGNIIWSLNLPDSAPNTEGAIEVIRTTSDGGLLLGGVFNAPNETLEGFKSYGNPTGGQAFVMHFTAAQINASTEPSAPTWSKVYDDSISVKDLRPLAEGGFVALASSKNEGDHLVKRMNERGDVLWSKGFTGSHGEGTAIAVMTALNETVGIAFTGHRGDEGTIDGFLTRLNANDGTTVWDKTFGDPAGGVGRFAGLTKGNPILIYDECWSVQATVDGGWVVGCGTGIEGCDLHAAGSAIRSECEADPRTTWRAMVTKFDSTGGFVWRRLDNFSEEGSDDVGPSACEHVALTSDGGLLAVNDEGFGIGLMRLGLQGSEVSPSGGSNSGTVTNTNQTPTQPQTEAQTEMRTIAADSCNAFGQSSSGAGLLLIAFFAVFVRRRTTSASF